MISKARLLRFLLTALPTGEPIDYALAWGVSENYASTLLREFWKRRWFSRTSKRHATGPRVYTRRET